MGRINYDEYSSLPDALGTGDFEILFGAIPGEANTNRLRLVCVSGILPGRNNQPLLINAHGFAFKFSGISEWTKSMPLTFNETADGYTTQRLRTWQESARGSRSGTSSGYKRSGSSPYAVDCRVNLFDTTGKTAFYCTIKNVFPEDVPDVNLEPQGQNMQLNATFSFDSAEYDFVTRR